MSRSDLYTTHKTLQEDQFSNQESDSSFLTSEYSEEEPDQFCIYQNTILNAPKLKFKNNVSMDDITSFQLDDHEEEEEDVVSELEQYEESFTYTKYENEEKEKEDEDEEDEIPTEACTKHSSFKKKTLNINKNQLDFKFVNNKLKNIADININAFNDDKEVPVHPINISNSSSNKSEGKKVSKFSNFLNKISN